MRVTLLGTGTSTGIPMIGCSCKTCSSPDSRDKRLRASALIESGSTTVLIDTSSDFRQQMLRAKVKSLDGILYTHYHTDHISGFDDLRAFHFLRIPVPMCYASEETYKAIQSMFPYAFGLVPNTGGAMATTVPFTVIDTTPFTIGDISIQAIPLDHGFLEIFGFRIGSFAYLTDCKRIPVASREKLKGVETLVIDGLRYAPHPTHMTIDEAISATQDIGAKMTYLTHMNHDVLHAEAEQKLAKNVRLGYDGLVLEI
jgi:phosphoribosyl 1,2-cyclic phosphate phosphodiesterase